MIWRHTGALDLLPDRVLGNCEEPQVVRYEMGDFFNWHQDALPEEEVSCSDANGGQRLATLLVYLNDVPASGGGATAFKHLNLKVLPQQGKALLFFPAFADGLVDERTEHAGETPISHFHVFHIFNLSNFSFCTLIVRQFTGSPAFDSKWIAQIWIHQKAYKPAVPPGNCHTLLTQLIQ